MKTEEVARGIFRTGGAAFALVFERFLSRNGCRNRARQTGAGIVRKPFYMHIICMGIYDAIEQGKQGQRLSENLSICMLFASE